MSENPRSMVVKEGMPTQVAHPARTTIRTVVQVTVALAALMPFLIEAIGLSESLPIVAGILAVAAAITRVAALPQVDAFLERFIPWLATGVHKESPRPASGKHAARPENENEDEAVAVPDVPGLPDAQDFLALENKEDVSR